MSADLIERLRAALEDVTPGPWDVMTCNTVRAIDGDVAIPLFDARTPWKKHRHTSTVVKQEWHNCRYVVAAQPDNIRLLLAHIERLESRIEAMRAALDDAEAVAAYASKAIRLTPAALRMLADEASAFLAAREDTR